MPGTSMCLAFFSAFREALPKPSQKVGAGVSPIRRNSVSSATWNHFPPAQLTPGLHEGGRGMAPGWASLSASGSCPRDPVSTSTEAPTAGPGGVVAHGPGSSGPARRAQPTPLPCRRTGRPGVTSMFTVLRTQNSKCKPNGESLFFSSLLPLRQPRPWPLWPAQTATRRTQKAPLKGRGRAPCRFPADVFQPRVGPGAAAEAQRPPLSCSSSLPAQGLLPVH